MPPRYAPEILFPKYRHVPGTTPHPRNHPDGHSRGRPEPAPVVPEPAGWTASRDYLHAIDLYNHGFWWECHESMEALFDAATEYPGQDQLFHGILQAALANLKWYQQSEVAANHLARQAVAKLVRVPGAAVGRFMGVDVAELARELEAFHLDGAGSAGRPGPPIIVLVEEP